MLECKDIRPLLPDYVAGRLEEEVAAQVADHLLLCPICSAEMEALRAAQYQPVPVAEARSFATEDPLADQKNTAPEAEEAAEAQTAATATEQMAAPEATAPSKPRLRRRTKVLIALIVLVVFGACVGILYSRDFFSIRDWEKTGDKGFAAVVYKGAQPGEKEGFRVRLWNGKAKEWHDEVAFYDATYRKLVWSPNGRFAAVEFTDTEGLDRVFVIDINGLTTADLQTVLTSYLERHEGYFGDVPLAAAPSCKILQWLPDSTRLLIAAEGVVDTNIDPDYGIEFAGSGSTPIQPRDNNAPTVSGYFAYEVDFLDIENIVGFGQSTDTQPQQTPSLLFERIRDFIKMDEPQDPFKNGMSQLFYGDQALLQLPGVMQAEVALQMYYYEWRDAPTGIPSLRTVGKIETDLQMLTKLESADDVMLVLVYQGTDPVSLYRAYLVVPFGAWIGARDFEINVSSGEKGIIVQ